MVMRIGGIASGMDIESIVNKLMEAERMPLERMQQDRTTLTWQRDAFRDINKKLLEFDNLMLNMRLSKTYQSKKVTSSQEGAVTASGVSTTPTGTYSIEVQKLASNAMNIGREMDIDPTKTFKELADEGVDVPLGEFKFFTFNEKENMMEEHTFTITEDDTLQSALRHINNASDNISAFYDKEAKRVVLETARTGNHNTTTEFNGAEIGFYAVNEGEGKEQNRFFTDFLNLDATKRDAEGNLIKAEIGGENARFVYNNGLEIESKNNKYEINNITFEFHNVTNGNARITIVNDTEVAFDAIKNFVDKYNEVIDLIHGSQQEERFRDFPPLTAEQKKELSESEIKQWEEKAKSGLLRGESFLTNGLSSMRQSWYAKVDTDGAYTSITQLGITTTAAYLDGGKLKIDEEKLMQALENGAEDVNKLFNGLITGLRSSVQSTMDRVEERAGKGTSTLDNYTIGKRMKDLDKRITAFEARMIRVENRHWSQFTAMEKAIQQMNNQSSQLFAQFGG